MYVPAASFGFMVTTHDVVPTNSTEPVEPEATHIVILLVNTGVASVA